jgi:hypothetical protein
MAMMYVSMNAFSLLLLSPQLSSLVALRPRLVGGTAKAVHYILEFSSSKCIVICWRPADNMEYLVHDESGETTATRSLAQAIRSDLNVILA